MVAKLTDRSVHCGVVGYDRAAVAEGTQILLRDKAGANSVAEFADGKAFTMRSDCLSIVLDNKKIMLIGDLADRLHVRALAI